MLVRLGFSLMTQVDADVLLIDEVLAVGDAAFQQKCFDAFANLHADGKTIILVTHDMASVEAHCDRAILLETGVIELEGDPADVARRYLELNFPEDRVGAVGEDAALDGTPRIRIAEVRLHDEAGEPATSFEQGETLGIDATVEVVRRTELPVLRFQVANADGLLLFAPEAVPLAGGRTVEPGERITVRARIGNPLASGHYFVNISIGRGADEPRPVAFRKNAADFIVFGTRPFAGLVELPAEIEVLDEPSGGPG
jgi:hypothetical protein